MNDSHIKQAVDYGVNEGVDWVVLTNGVEWQIYKLKFERPVSAELVCSFDLTSLNARKQTDLENVFLLCREGISKDVLKAFHHNREAMNRYVMGQLLISDGVVSLLRRELRRISPDASITVDEIRDVLVDDVIRRNALEGDEAKQAATLIKRKAKQALRKSRAKVEKPETEKAGKENVLINPSNTFNM